MKRSNAQETNATGRHRPRPRPPAIVTPTFVRVPLSTGGYAVVDPEDAAPVLPHMWSVNRYGHAFARIDGRTTYLARLVLDLGPGQRATFRDGDRLNCRRANIWSATDAEVNRSSRMTPKNRAGYKGVAARPNGRRWLAQITVDRRRRYLGDFDTPEEAAEAYDTAARRYFGRWACVNFPRPGERAARG